MTKKEMELEIKKLHEEVLGLAMAVEGRLKTADAFKRDYIVRTKYIGKLTHKQLKEDFKQEIVEKLKDTFDSVTNNILNYRFYDVDNRINLLNRFYETLKDYETKQIVIDTYGTKECK